MHGYLDHGRFCVMYVGYKGGKGSKGLINKAEFASVAVYTQACVCGRWFCLSQGNKTEEMSVVYDLNPHWQALKTSLTFQIDTCSRLQLGSLFQFILLIYRKEENTRDDNAKKNRNNKKHVPTQLDRSKLNTLNADT